eukprot:488410-Rhodomonas_salina.1
MMLPSLASIATASARASGPSDSQVKSIAEPEKVYNIEKKLSLCAGGVPVRGTPAPHEAAEALAEALAKAKLELERNKASIFASG